MLRYRIIRNETGEHFVISALAWLVPIAETYATRAAAQDTADWLNRLARDEIEANAGARVPSATGFENAASGLGGGDPRRLVVSRHSTQPLRTVRC